MLTLYIKLLSPETFRLYDNAIIGYITKNLIQPTGDLAQSLRKYVLIAVFNKGN